MDQINSNVQHRLLDGVNGSMSAIAGQTMGRTIHSVPPTQSASIIEAMGEYQYCQSCYDDFDLASEDITACRLKHFYHTKCIDRCIKTSTEPRNPNINCPHCREPMPLTMPTWDGQVAVIKIQKKEVESNKPVYGVPITFDVPGTDITVALGFKGTPWLTAYSPHTPDPSCVPVVTEDQILNFNFKPSLSIRSKILSFFCCSKGSDANQNPNLRLALKKMSMQPNWPKLFKLIADAASMPGSYEDNFISLLVTCESAKQPVNFDGLLPLGSIKTMSPELLGILTAIAIEINSKPDCNKDTITEEIIETLTYITNKTNDRWFVYLLPETLLPKDLKNEKLVIFDSPMSDIKWCSPATQNQGDYSIEVHRGKTPSLFSGFRLAWRNCFGRTGNLTKLSDLTFKMTVTNANCMKTFAELSGIAFTGKKTKSAVFHNAIIADTDLKKTEAFKKFREDYKKEIAALGGEESFCIRIQLEQQHAISGKDNTAEMKPGLKPMKRKHPANHCGKETVVKKLR